MNFRRAAQTNVEQNKLIFPRKGVQESQQAQATISNNNMARPDELLAWVNAGGSERLTWYYATSLHQWIIWIIGVVYHCTLISSHLISYHLTSFHLMPVPLSNMLCETEIISLSVVSPPIFNDVYKLGRIYVFDFLSIVCITSVLWSRNATLSSWRNVTIPRRNVINGTQWSEH